MPSTYKAVEVTSPGKFNLVEREVIEPKSGQVRIRVQACGVCHSDFATVSGEWPGMVYPRVPGHEAIGLIELGQESPDGRLGSASAWVSSAVKTAPASPAAAATS